MNTSPTHVIAITSGKGGVGKSHTTVNLGIALAQSGKRVLLLDADLGLANINVLLGFQPLATLADMFAGKATLDDIIVHHRSGIDIIPAASGVSSITQLTDDEQRTLVHAIDSLPQPYDYMLIDTAAGIGDNVLYFNAAAEDVFLVVDPEPTSITDAYALMKVLFAEHGRNEFSVIVNRAPVGSDGRATYAKLAAVCDRFLDVRLNLLGSVAEDSSVQEAVCQQRAFLDVFPSTRASVDICRIAQKLGSMPRSPSATGGMQFFFQSLLNAS